MKAFEFRLSNTVTLTGICNLPPRSSSNQRQAPLIVGIHGGSYKSSYFHADEKHTAKLSSDALGVPFVAIDRPCYGGSTSLLPIPSESSFQEELATRLHQLILPRIWTEFGQTSHCNCIVLHAHSLGAPGAVIASALHAREHATTGKSSYPLGGLILSGFGTRQINPGFNPFEGINPPPTTVNYPLDLKQQMMLPDGTADAEIYKIGEQMDEPMPMQEMQILYGLWLDPAWRSRWTNNVKVPLMIGLFGKDCFWVPTEEHLQEFIACFPGSPRRDGSIVKGAPHCTELSHWSQGWYARCFGFAMECAESQTCP